MSDWRRSGPPQAYAALVAIAAGWVAAGVVVGLASGISLLDLAAFAAAGFTTIAGWAVAVRVTKSQLAVGVGTGAVALVAWTAAGSTVGALDTRSTLVLGMGAAVIAGSVGAAAWEVRQRLRAREGAR